MVELRTDSATPEPPAGGLFGAPLAARLRDWLDQSRPREAAPTTPSCCCLPRTPRPSRTLAGTARAAARRRALPKGLAATPPVASILRIPVDAEVAIEVLHTPIAARFAPLWPLAAHAALATCSCSRRHRGAVAALRQAVEPLARCRARAAFTCCSRRRTGTNAASAHSRRSSGSSTTATRSRSRRSARTKLRLRCANCSRACCRRQARARAVTGARVARTLRQADSRRAAIRVSPTSICAMPDVRRRPARPGEARCCRARSTCARGSRARSAQHPARSPPRWTRSPSTRRDRLAQNGGIGISTRTCRSTAQAREVEQVKRAETGMIVDPITVRPEQSIREALERDGEHKHLRRARRRRAARRVGILTDRDLRFEKNPIR